MSLLATSSRNYHLQEVSILANNICLGPCGLEIWPSLWVVLLTERIRQFSQLWSLPQKIQIPYILATKFQRLRMATSVSTLREDTTISNTLMKTQLGTLKFSTLILSYNMLPIGLWTIWWQKFAIRWWSWFKISRNWSLKQSTTKELRTKEISTEN